MLPNTYTQIYIQIVFAVKRRENLIQPEHREEIHKYITGICKNLEQKMMSIFAMPDHLHMLVSFRPSISISDFVGKVKAGSSGFINKQNWCRHHFNWQSSFGAFSYSQREYKTVAAYIERQEEHHRNQTFRQEYEQLLKDFNVDYNPLYLFEDLGG